MNGIAARVSLQAIAIACASIAGPAFAQDALETRDAPQARSGEQASDAPDAGAGEIIVTARKRDESIRDVPATVTAQTADQLLAKGPITGVGDLLQQVPGVRFNGLQSENLAEISIRGSGTQRATSADSGVGLFVNGAYVGSSTLGGRNFKRIDYFDVARVEVLEGPQGALYGRNSEFGTVNVVLAEPLFNDSGKVSVNYVFEQQQLQVESVANKKLSSDLALRVGVQLTGQASGIYYNPSRNEYYDQTDGIIARGQLRYASGGLDVTLLADVMDMDLPSFVSVFVAPPGGSAFLPKGYFGPEYDVPSTVRNGVHQNVKRVMLIGKLDLGGATLTSTSMVMRSTSLQDFQTGTSLEVVAALQRDGQLGLYPLGRTQTIAKNETYYQDLHLTGEAVGGRLNWLFGIEGIVQNDFYTRDTATSPCPFTINAGICGGTPAAPVCFQVNPQSNPCPTTFPNQFGNRREVPSKYRSAAVYASLGYEIGNLSLNGELRFSHDYKTATQSDFRLFTTVPIGAPSTYSFKKDNVSYTATASYKLGGGIPTLIYAKVGTGYRAGGVNNGTFNAAALNPLQPTYGNETTISYEAGLKSDLADNLFLRVSAYTARTEDAITGISDGCTVANACGQAGAQFNINGGTVRSRGIEAALDATMPVGAGRMKISLNGAHQRAKFIAVPTGATGLPIVGTSVAQTPDWTMSANANLRHPLGQNVEGFINLAYNGQRGGGQDTVTAATPLIPLADIDNVDARVGFDFDGVEVAFFMKNVFDKVVPVLTLTSGGLPLVVRNSLPRTTGLSVAMRF
ncbi:MAG: hypothetical protein CVT78_13045 [Alphaproteobacteria bacterium HGW-Alphaproteobacteria-17]|nr:MAG: hypothetical protein CVT78_13045 [Alphaproteobacteria bacterium HGW-Alphaproteobacteria-17]